MSKLFYDNIVVLSAVEAKIKSSTDNEEERNELWSLVDEIVVNKVLETVFTILPTKDHGEFLELFHKCPHDEVLIFGYLANKTGKKVENLLADEVKKIEKEILESL